MPKNKGETTTDEKDERRVNRSLRGVFFFSNFAQITWGELAHKTTQQSNEKGEKNKLINMQRQEAERVRVKLPSRQIKICLTRSLLNNPLVSTPFRNINILLGKGDFLMGEVRSRQV